MIIFSSFLDFYHGHVKSVYTFSVQYEAGQKIMRDRRGKLPEQLASVLEREIEAQAGRVSDVNEFLKLVDSTWIFRGSTLPSSMNL